MKQYMFLVGACVTSDAFKHEFTQYFLIKAIGTKEAELEAQDRLNNEKKVSLGFKVRYNTTQISPAW